MSLSNNYDLLAAPVKKFLESPQRLLIDGQWTSSAGGAMRTIIDPSNGKGLVDVPDATSEDVDLAVRAARKAFEHGSWSKLRPFERERLLLKLADLIEAHSEELSQLETLSSGKLIANTRIFDVEHSAHLLRYMAGWPSKASGKTLDLNLPYMPEGDFTGYTSYQPVGVVACITPWNVPLGMAVFKLAPALAAGCTVVLKPSEQTPFTALRLGELCLQAGIPEGVVNVITGDGQAGADLVAHPDVDKVNFTGSTNVGRKIASIVAPQFKRYNLEMGGKSPVVIAHDADLDIAIPGAAWAILGNHGQNCCAGSRLYVHESLFEKVIAGVQDIANGLQIGPGLDPKSELGPMASHGHRDKVMSYIEDGVREGGSLLFGGDDISDPGAYMKPAMMLELPQNARAVQEEIFGPVLVASPFSDLSEAIGQANATPFGLGASIWSRDASTIHQFSKQVDAGKIWINNHNTLDFALPFGGWKQSGVGHELGEESFKSHLKIKARIVCH